MVAPRYLRHLRYPPCRWQTVFTSTRPLVGKTARKERQCDIRATVCRDRNTISLLTNSFFVANLQQLARFRDAHELTCVNVDPALGVKNHNLASPAGTPPQKKARLLALLHRWMRRSARAMLSRGLHLPSNSAGKTLGKSAGKSNFSRSMPVLAPPKTSCRPDVSCLN